MGSLELTLTSLPCEGFFFFLFSERHDFNSFIKSAEIDTQLKAHHHGFVHGVEQGLHAFPLFLIRNKKTLSRIQTSLKIREALVFWGAARCCGDKKKLVCHRQTEPRVCQTSKMRQQIATRNKRRLIFMPPGVRWEQCYINSLASETIVGLPLAEAVSAKIRSKNFNLLSSWNGCFAIGSGMFSVAYDNKFNIYDTERICYSNWWYRKRTQTAASFGKLKVQKGIL